jgi:hypothetical protein
MDQQQQHVLLGALLALAYALQARGMRLRSEELVASLPGHSCTKATYAASVSLAALGFLLLLTRLGGETRGVAGRWFAAFAVVSACWLPLALLAVRCPSAPWAGPLVRAQLWVAAGLAVLWMLEVARLGDAPALLGAFLLAGNSCWMDALSWPCLLPP